MARKKHDFHCKKCNSTCTIYKKGKGHRVLVCPRCGVLATNPFSVSDTLGDAAAGAAIGSIVPGIGTTAGAIIGGGIGAVSGYLGGEDKPKHVEGSVPHHERARMNSDQRLLIKDHLLRQRG